MPLTTDPNDPRLHSGAEGEQHEAYLVLSEKERAKGFVRPVRRSYLHVGVRPKWPLRDLTPEQQEMFADCDYVKYETYPESESPCRGRFWTQAQLDSGCGTVATMAQAIAETYAREPHFYGSTYCCGCREHLPVEEFVWEPDGSRVGS